MKKKTDTKIQESQRWKIQWDCTQHEAQTEMKNILLKLKEKTNQSIRQKQIAFPNIASTTMDDGEKYQRPPGAQKHRL